MERLTNSSSSYARFYGRSHRAVIRVYDAAGNAIRTLPQISPTGELTSKATQRLSGRNTVGFNYT